MHNSLYNTFLEAKKNNHKLLAILIDPEKFALENTASFLRNLPSQTTHIFVGGSTVPEGSTASLIREIKLYTAKPVILFPGDVSQITETADGLLFLSLLSGRNPEYLIEQQVKAVSKLRGSQLEVISTGYILINGANESAIARVTNTQPIDQININAIVDTAKAGELMGAKLMYLEAGSGAKVPVSSEIINAVKKELAIPLIVGGGIKTKEQMEQAYNAGATMIVMGTAFEN